MLRVVGFRLCVATQAHFLLRLLDKTGYDSRTAVARRAWDLLDLTLSAPPDHMSGFALSLQAAAALFLARKQDGALDTAPSEGLCDGTAYDAKAISRCAAALSKLRSDRGRAETRAAIDEWQRRVADLQSPQFQSQSSGPSISLLTHSPPTTAPASTSIFKWPTWMKNLTRKRI